MSELSPYDKAIMNLRIAIQEENPNKDYIERYIDDAKKQFPEHGYLILGVTGSIIGINMITSIIKKNGLHK